MRQIILDFGTINLLGLSFSLRIYGYGLMLVLGFLLSIGLAQWRARRLGENPEIMAHVGLWCVVGGILGARLAYVIQHWEQFQGQPLEMLNVTSGGLIYYGGLILAVLLAILYLWRKKVPMRRYLDILAISTMLGLAFGRAGCLLNGCCYGARGGGALAMTFPMYSKPLLKLDSSPGPYSAGTEYPTPVYAHQYEQDEIRPDFRLTCLARDVQLKAIYGRNAYQLLPPRDFHALLANDQVGVMYGTKEQAGEKFDALAPRGLLARETWSKALAEHKDGLLRGSEIWQEAILFDRDRDGRLSFDETWNYLQDRRGRLEEVYAQQADKDSPDLQLWMNSYLQADLYDLASKERSPAVKPSQAIGIANALVLAGLLTLFFRLRSREGQVFALMAMLYPVTRFVEEMIRDDNAHDLLRGILTHNQYTSLVLFAIGVGMWLWLLRFPASAGPAWAQRLALAGSTSTGQMPRKRHQNARNGQRS